MGFRGCRFFSPKSSNAKNSTLGTSEAKFGGKKLRIILREVRYSFNSSSVILARCKRDEERLCANYSTPVVVERIHTFSWIQIQIADLPYLSGYKTGFSAL